MQASRRGSRDRLQGAGNGETQNRNDKGSQEDNARRDQMAETPGTASETKGNGEENIGQCKDCTCKAGEARRGEKKQKRPGGEGLIVAEDVEYRGDEGESSKEDPGALEPDDDRKEEVCKRAMMVMVTVCCCHLLPEYTISCLH